MNCYASFPCVSRRSCRCRQPGRRSRRLRRQPESERWMAAAARERRGRRVGRDDRDSGWQPRGRARSGAACCAGDEPARECTGRARDRLHRLRQLQRLLVPDRVLRRRGAHRALSAAAGVTDSPASDRQIAAASLRRREPRPGRPQPTRQCAAPTACLVASTIGDAAAPRRPEVADCVAACLVARLQARAARCVALQRSDCPGFVPERAIARLPARRVALRAVPRVAAQAASAAGTASI